MVDMKCPRCATLVTVKSGEMAECLNCGFRALAPPVGAIAPAAAPVPEAPAPAAETIDAVKSPAMWAYLAAVVALGTFFLAGFVLPFMFAVTAIGVGFWAHLQNRSDHRGMMAMVIGTVALVACAGFLAV